MKTEDLELLGKTRYLVRELSKIEDMYFDTMIAELPKTTDEGEEWLFDFIFNGDEDESFSDYLAKYNKTLTDIFV